MYGTVAVKIMYFQRYTVPAGICFQLWFEQMWGYTVASRRFNYHKYNPMFDRSVLQDTTVDYFHHGTLFMFYTEMKK